MADRARDANRYEVSAIEETFYAHHGVRAQELQRRFGAVEIDRAALHHLDQYEGQLACIDFQSNLKRLSSGKPGTDATETLSCDRPVQSQLAAPVHFAAEGVV